MAEACRCSSYSPMLRVALQLEPTHSDSAPTQPQYYNPHSTSTRRIVSNASIADPNQDSAGARDVWASTEKASDLFANNFMTYVLGWMWPSGITLDWVKGREGLSVLAWNNSYCPFHCSSLILAPIK